MDSPKYLSGKLSYQGKMLESRIKQAFKALDDAKEQERKAKQNWLEAQLKIMKSENSLAEVLEVKRINDRKK